MIYLTNENIFVTSGQAFVFKIDKTNCFCNTTTCAISVHFWVTKQALQILVVVSVMLRWRRNESVDSGPLRRIKS